MQLVNILQDNSKIRTVRDLINNYDSIADLAKDDVHRIAISRQIIFSDFDSIFATASKITKNQLTKSHLKGIKRFLNSKNLDYAIIWLVERLLNTMRNITTNKRYKEYLTPPKFINYYQDIQIFNNFTEDSLVINIDNINVKTLKQGLKKLWVDTLLDRDFNLLEFEDLCTKCGFFVNDVLGYDPLERPEMASEQTKSGNIQSVLIF